MLTCVLLNTCEGLLERVGGVGALGGVRRQAVGVDRLHGGMSVGLMRDAGESVDDGRDDAGHGGRGDVGGRRTEACWEKKSYRMKETHTPRSCCILALMRGHGETLPALQRHVLQNKVSL